ncbi:MAG: ribonuclease HII [Candidatus Omnitrophota bacterium]
MLNAEGHHKMWQLEKDLFARGVKNIAGVDEAGRGPLAGPVVAAAVIVTPNYLFKEKIADSKILTSLQREKAYQEITENSQFAYSIVDEKEIDTLNILQATLKAMQQAVDQLEPKPDWVLIDGPHTPNLNYPCSGIINGDAKSISIACASIIAKVVRDSLMREFDKIYPEYGFAQHKGYGTKAHTQAIFEHGPCPIHRRSFQPIKGMLA